MFCPKCGTQNPDNGKFCRSCGTDLTPVSAALAGKTDSSPADFRVNESGAAGWSATPGSGQRQRTPSLEGAIGRSFMGIAFVIVSIALAFSGKNWWFWMLIPAFSLLGSGIAQYVQLKSGASGRGPMLPTSETNAQATVNAVNSAPPNTALPPTKTEYVPPAVGSIYDTGEFAAPPASVTENTTRHLEINNDGETMTLPKK